MQKETSGDLLWLVLIDKVTFRGRRVLGGKGYCFNN